MAVRTIVLILLLAYPAGLSAQVAQRVQQQESYAGPAASSSTPAPTPILKPHNPANRAEAGQKPGGPPSAVTLGGSLALVLGIFFLVAWAIRRASPHRFGILPTEALEILGRAPLANRQQVHLLRCGNKLLLVSVGADGAKTLTEITDPLEVDRLAGLCQQSAAGGRQSAIGGGWWAKWLCFALLLAVGLSFSGAAHAADPPDQPANQSVSMGLPEGLIAGPKAWISPEGLGSTLQVMLLLTVLSLAPAALLMTTCFVRIVVVLSLLRQAIGAQNLPPTQVITTLSLFLTLLIMTPVWKQAYDEAIVPYTRHEIGAENAWNAGIAPVRSFMSMQIENTRNTEDVWLFMNYLPDYPTPSSYDDVPLQALLPAFMLSELKTAFLIGFQIYLPFLILDMVVASVMVSMGMFMVPPVLISLPLKLLLFVLVDGWHLVVGTLLQSFQPFT